MRHLKAGRKLNRNASHRLAMFRNMSRSLFEHGRILTTVAKAKEARGFVERLITLAKRAQASGDPIQSLHYRRLALSLLHDREAIDVLFRRIAPRYVDRPGGYTRVIKLHKRRLGDAGETAYLELLAEGETKTRKRTPAPVAPQVQPTAPTAE